MIYVKCLNSFTISGKLKVIFEAEKINDHPTGIHDIPESCTRDWRKRKEKLQ